MFGSCLWYSPVSHRKFKVVTDHQALQYLRTMKLSPHSRLTRWSLFLQQYDFELIYKKDHCYKQLIAFLVYLGQQRLIQYNNGETEGVTLLRLQQILPKPKTVKTQSTLLNGKLLFISIRKRHSFLYQQWMISPLTTLRYPLWKILLHNNRIALTSQIYSNILKTVHCQ